MRTTSTSTEIFKDEITTLPQYTDMQPNIKDIMTGADSIVTIKDIEAKLEAIPAAELPQHLVGHKCASDFVSSTPEIREFRRSEAVVDQFTCTNAGGDAIRAVNLFTVTPWGTPQMVGVSGHESYWSANPELLEKIGNSYRANRWKLAG